MSGRGRCGCGSRGPKTAADGQAVHCLRSSRAASRHQRLGKRTEADVEAGHCLASSRAASRYQRLGKRTEPGRDSYGKVVPGWGTQKGRLAAGGLGADADRFPGGAPAGGLHSALVFWQGVAIPGIGRGPGSPRPAYYFYVTPSE